MNFEFESIWW